MSATRLRKPAVCVLLAAAAILLAVQGCRAAPRPGTAAARVRPRPLPVSVRGVWVARFHYRYPDDVRTIIRRCAELGCNTVFWQVRGCGTVTYPSALEPWSREFEHRDPGYDPLALAVAEAHRRGLRIEAWVNVLPGWRGPRPPALPQQLWNAHPEWFLRDSRGRRQPLGDFYVILNPCLPEVRRHISDVIDEIATNYDIDGVHLDYVRYAWDTTPDARRRYPRDARTLALFRRETGLAPDDDPTAWDHWRANQLTRLVAGIRARLDRRRRGATLTAAVIRHPRTAYQEFFQNGVAWLRTGLVDALLPMAYTRDVGRFEADVRAYRELAGARRIVPGLGIYQHHGPEEMWAQLERCRTWGGDFALFSYASLYPTHADRAAGRPSSEVQAQRETRRRVLERFLSRR